MELTGKVVPSSAFDPAFTSTLYDLYARTYAPTDPAVFARDLAAKSYCITVSDNRGRLCGFSTVRRSRMQTCAGAVTVLFSGDTVIDRAYWGEQTLPFTWIAEAGRIKAEQPDQPLFWLLITKGHRTFRYLPAFAHSYHPRQTADTSLHGLADDIAFQAFGTRLNRQRGVLMPDPTCPTALRPAFSGLDAARHGNPHVQFFLSRNPGHARGEELVCLCELSVENLRPRARRQFERGMA